MTITTFRPGLVVPTNTTIDLIDVPDTNDIRLFRSRIEHLDTRVCFYSLSGDCWWLETPDFDPKPTKERVDDPAHRWKG